MKHGLDRIYTVMTIDRLHRSNNFGCVLLQPSVLKPSFQWIASALAPREGPAFIICTHSRGVNRCTGKSMHGSSSSFFPTAKALVWWGFPRHSPAGRAGGCKGGCRWKHDISEYSSSFAYDPLRPWHASVASLTMGRCGDTYTCIPLPGTPEVVTLTKRTHMTNLIADACPMQKTPRYPWRRLKGDA